MPGKLRGIRKMVGVGPGNLLRWDAGLVLMPDLQAWKTWVTLAGQVLPGTG